MADVSSSNRSGLERLLYAFVSAIAVALVNSVVDHLRFGEFRLHRSLVVGLSIGLVFWLLWAIIDRYAASRRRRTRDSGPYAVPSRTASRRHMLRMRHEDVDWRIVSLVSWMDEALPPEHRHPTLHVETPPRCPKCGTELNQSQAFLGSWHWVCPAGDFSTRSSRSFALVAGDVLKLARRTLENRDS